MPSKEKKQRNINRCELCAMPAFKNPERHMKRYHSDLLDKTFRRLQQGWPPSGDWKYCSNWQDIWNENFEAKDVVLKKGQEFEAKNKVAGKRKAKEIKRTLLYYHCEILHQLGECTNVVENSPLKIYKPA